jgi:hypothetical protein
VLGPLDQLWVVGGRYQGNAKEGSEKRRLSDLVEVRTLSVNHSGKQLHGTLLTVGGGEAAIYTKEEWPWAAVPKPVLGDGRQQPCAAHVSLR